METLLEILEDIRPDVDFKSCNTLIDDHILDSLAIISLIAEISVVMTGLFSVSLRQEMGQREA